MAVLLPIFAIVFGNFLLRTIVVLSLKKFGLWDLRWDHKWPRLPWRPVWRAIAWVSQWYERSFGMRRRTARFAGVLSSLSLLYKPGTFLIGRARCWFGATTQPMGIDKIKRHLMIVAETGVGKSVFLNTMIALWRKLGAIWVLDPKGQIYKAQAAHLKAQGRKVGRFDPMKLTGGTDCINAFHMLDYANKTNGNGDDLSGIIIKKWATDMIEAGGHSDPIWHQAPQLIAAALLHETNRQAPEDRNFVYFRQLITRGWHQHSDDPEEARFIMWDVLARDETANDTIRAGASIMAGEMTKQKESFLITLIEATAWIDNSFIKPLLKETTFEPWAVKGTNDAFFLIAPVSEIKGTFAKMFRMLISSSIYAHEIMPNVPGGESTLFAIDEFPNLGFMEEINKALPLLRGYQVIFCGVCQNIRQIQTTYRDTWSGFIGGSDATIWMGVNDPSTADYLSGVLGRRTYVRKTPMNGTRRWWRGFRRQKSKHYEEHPLIDADQIKRATSGERMIVTRFGKLPLWAHMVSHFDWLRVDMYEADKDHGDTFTRANGRAIAKKASLAATSVRTEWKRRFGKPMPEAHARALLGGISGTFTRSELQARAAMVAATFPPDLIDAALATLEPMSVGGVA